MTLAYAHGGPVLHGNIKQSPEDFIVEEVLGFEPGGGGEHVFLQIRKRLLNTFDVVKRLSRLSGVRERDIGFAGLKDRQAVTTQWFSVQWPKGAEPDWSALNVPGQLEVLDLVRHAQKLRRGVHRGNRFTLHITACTGDATLAGQRLQALSSQGAPNYFGEQRFGRERGNIARAEQMFASGEAPRDRRLRGLFLSAARAELFNQVLSERVTRGDWNQALLGDLMMLAGTRSHFLVEELNESLETRLAMGDLSATGPLWGTGALRTTESVRALEQAVIAPYASLAQGLESCDLSQDRRALVMRPEGLEWEWQGDALRLSFGLSRGCYATSLLREVVSTESAGDEPAGE